MKGSIRYIGVLDHSGKQHFVEFYDGVNVITGRSSTGKSAIIEIFDYCFGKDENTIPHGVITDNAKLYFCVMSVNDNYIVLARKATVKTAFIRDESSLPDLSKLTIEYFVDDYFLPLETFKKSLNNHFNLKITDTDEDTEARNYRKNKAKAPCASVRHFVSFMLQHQNLIANKHALFYRFDEKEKREQTIDQFKIFLGFVDQEYYLKKQELADANRNLRDLTLQKAVLDKNRQDIKNSLISLLSQYEYITGSKFVISEIEQIVNDPVNSLDKIKSFVIDVEDNTETFAQRYKEYDEEYERLDYEIHEKWLELEQVRSSIKAGEKYSTALNSIREYESANIFASECPFCKKRNENITNEVNTLQSAINWLNDELLKTPVLTDSFLVKEKKLESEINNLKHNRRTTLTLRTEMENATKQIKERKSRFEQAIGVKVRIETLIQDKLIGNTSELLEQIQLCEDKIKQLNSFLRNTYDIDRKIKSAEECINENMNAIGKKLDFEQAYQPVNLKFSLNSFDLYFDINGKPVYLRSVGSGANWLACHISLFTALIKYFCQQGNSCLIPPILFLDQPSQVYFPTSIDISEIFDAKELKKNEGKENEADADMKSVTNLYQQLVDFCNKTAEETNIMPQVIITDHADNLKLTACNFDTDLVRGRRWRNEYDGFIKLTDSGSNKNNVQSQK